MNESAMKKRLDLLSDGARPNPGQPKQLTEDGRKTATKSRQIGACA
jgi:hypothetical protein